MESKTAFVWTESGIVLIVCVGSMSLFINSSETGWLIFSYLNTESAIDLRDTLIVFPYDAEL